MLHLAMAFGSSLPQIIRVAIVEDTQTLREGLSTLIGGTVGFACTGKFATMEEALAHIGPTTPHVALVDIGLPGMSGIEGVGLLKQRYPGLILLMLTVYDDDEPADIC
jgi:DNA-binding NarL/FixJ family response regulator